MKRYIRASRSDIDITLSYYETMKSKRDSRVMQKSRLGHANTKLTML